MEEEVSTLVVMMGRACKVIVREKGVERNTLVGIVVSDCKIDKVWKMGESDTYLEL